MTKHCVVHPPVSEDGLWRICRDVFKNDKFVFTDTIAFPSKEKAEEFIEHCREYGDKIGEEVEQE
jgi:hypothetical protein